MKKLPLRFTKSGFNHVQVKRRGNVALYERRRIGGYAIHFEVVRIREQKATEWETASGARMTLEAKELYPNAEQWGSFGWTYPDRENAIRRFSELAIA